MEKKNLTPSEIVKLAYKEAVFEVVFDLPLSANHTMPVMLESLEVPDIWAEQGIIKAQLLKRYKDAGLDKEDYDKDLWQETIDKVNKTDRKGLTPPKNLAEQKADRESNMRVIVELVPKRLKDPITKKLLFTEKETLDSIKKIIWKSPTLVGLIAKKYGEVSAAGSEVKN